MRGAVAVALAWCLLGWPSGAQAVVDEAASRACVKCHDEEDLPDMRRSAHAATADARTPGCVTCHGPSSAHMERGGRARPRPDRSFTKNAGSPSAERSAVCLTCHDRQAKRSLWAGSAHEAADVACTACHRIHTNHDRVLAKATQTEVCTACHKEQRAQFLRPSRHPVPEGKMSCADCHNAHGSAGPKLARRDSTNDTCYACHAEKRGPFVHPHEPVTEDCASCHNPHGSTVAAMLKARAPILCHQCHTPHVTSGVGAVGGQPGVLTPAAPGVPPAVGAVSSGKNVINFWQGRSCLNCHTQIHGSNNPAAAQPRPQLLLR
jgi:DmsE family decaheme c-type cytochrome